MKTYQSTPTTSSHISRMISLMIIFFFVLASLHITGLASSYHHEHHGLSTPSFATHEIYGIARYSDGVLAAGAKVEVVSSYGVLSDWVNAVGEWSVNVGDPGPNWANGTMFTAYGIGCCDHDGWSGRKQGVVSGNENNMGTITLTSNQPPETPEVPSGPPHILRGMTGNYTTKSVDPNYKHTIQYRFDWDSAGEHNYSQFTSSTPSGMNVTVSHHWDEPGSYLVTAIAKDNYGSKSPWSQGLEVTVHASNMQPDTPVIDGVVEAVKKRDYTFTITGTDPDGHDLYYQIDWGDGTITSWIGPYDSGELVQITHLWQDIGTYTISVKSKDIIGEESTPQSHDITVLGPSLRIQSVRAEQGSVMVTIENTGEVEAEYVEWGIMISGKRLFSGDHTDGIYYVINGLETVTIQSEPVFGLGLNYDVAVMISYDDGEELLEWEGRALIIFTFLMIR